jgi:hypothetical protein
VLVELVGLLVRCYTFNVFVSVFQDDNSSS